MTLPPPPPADHDTLPPPDEPPTDPNLCPLSSLERMLELEGEHWLRTHGGEPE